MCQALLLLFLPCHAFFIFFFCSSQPARPTAEFSSVFCSAVGRATTRGLRHFDCNRAGFRATAKQSCALVPRERVWREIQSTECSSSLCPCSACRFLNAPSARAYVQRRWVRLSIPWRRLDFSEQWKRYELWIKRRIIQAQHHTITCVGSSSLPEPSL